MDKIKEWIKQNKQLTIIICGIVFVLIVVIIALIPRKGAPGVALIEQPLYFYQKRRVTIPEETYNDFKLPKKRLEVYKIKNENQNIKVEGIITQLNINAPTKTTYSNVAYEWKNKDGDRVSYDTKTQSVTFKLENRANVFPDLVAPSDAQLQTLLASFVHKYINENYSYTDVQVTKGPGEITISGRRVHNNIPLQVPGVDKQYDYITLDDKNLLKSAQILIVNFEDKATELLTLLKPEQVANVISRPNYPKEINDGRIEGLSEESEGVSASMTDNFSEETIPRPVTYTAKDIELVYLFSNTSLQFITPVYRLNVVGQIIYKGNTYDVNGVVNVSNIDPNHVYIPSNIIYAD